jgi:hypothetical protein
MPTYTCKCIECGSEIKVSSDIWDLTDEQLKELVEDGYTEITEDQVRKSGIALTEEEKEILEEEGVTGYNENIESICSACGSDQDYDEDGNNITAL